MRESAEDLTGVIACSVQCRCRAFGWMVVHPSRRGVGCEMGRHRRNFGGWKYSRGGRSGAGDGSMCLGDGHPRCISGVGDGSTSRGDGDRRRGASSRRCRVVDERMNHALDVAAAAAAAEAEADVVDPLSWQQNHQKSIEFCSSLLILYS